MGDRFNILFLGGAKRVSMARMFKSAGGRRGLDVGIYSYELTHHVPVAAEGTVIEGRRWSDPDVLTHLADVIARHDVRVMIPFVDPAVGVATRYAEMAGAEGWPQVFVPAGESALSDRMFDKLLSAEVFARAGIPAPAEYLKGRPEFPLIAKPRTGSASKGIEILNTAADFRRISPRLQEYLVQEYISPCREFTVDCYVNRAGRICCVSPRIRLEVTGGEVSRTRTVHDQTITDLTCRLLRSSGLRGAVTVQYIRDLLSGRTLIMEVNPRLGGGAVCSVHAGCDIPGMIIDEALDREPGASRPESGVEIARYFDEVVFRPDER